MEDVEIWQECEEVHHGATVQPHTGLFGSVPSHSHASIGHFEFCAPPPPPPPPPPQSPFLSHWGLHESWISPRGVDELHDLITLIPSTSGDDGTVAAVDRALSLASLQSQRGAIDSLQDVGNRSAWGHGFYSNQAAMSTEVHAFDCRGSAAAGVPDHNMQWMIDQHLQTLSNSSSPFSYNVLPGAESMIMESSLGSVLDKVWNSRTDPFAAIADSLITSPIGSMFHSISTGSCLNLYLQESNKCEGLQKGSDLMKNLHQNKIYSEDAQGRSPMYQKQNKAEAQRNSVMYLQNKCEAQRNSVMYLKNKCEAPVTLKPRGASQVSGTEEGVSSPGACTYIADEFLQRQKGSKLASSLPSPLLMQKKKKKKIMSSAAAAPAASNTRKRTLWPAEDDNNNKIGGFVHKMPIAKWPVVVEGCSRLEAVSTLAHHTVVTQNKCNACTLGPALNTNLKPRARQGSANDPQSIAARVRRERISDRLKALQLLIPNGDKVDMVTMLEKAINYVQCLELQIRMLKDDSLWPKAIGVLPNTLQELLELAGPAFTAFHEEEEHYREKEKTEHIQVPDPLSSTAPS